ncbi:MAG: hypothetical protein GX616_07690 [Planctomycetes bacterium]|nr:hypothetical protein [Planctomycetota bacterium]
MSVSPSPSPAVEQTDKRAVESLLRDGEPAWDAISFEVGCSRCGYNLRMLPQPRCPECGLEFDWRDVLDASAWRSEFLFEHHWRHRFFGSWLKTTWAGLRPFRFWRNVSIHDRIHPDPLWFLLLTSVLWFPITMKLVAWLGWLAAEAALQVAGKYESMRPLWELLNVARRHLSGVRFELSDLDEVVWTLGFLLTGLLAALAMLCGLRQTIGQCRLRTVQLLRVVAYASAPAFICLGVCFVLVTVLIDTVPRSAPSSLQVCVRIGAMTVFTMCPAFFLFAGLRRYLHLPHAALAAFAAALVGLLFAGTVILLIALSR